MKVGASPSGAFPDGIYALPVDILYLKLANTVAPQESGPN